MQPGADPGRQLVFDQLLQRPSQQIAEQRTGRVVDQAGSDRGLRCIIGLGHRLASLQSPVE
jgi:hypothetical protein